MIQLVFIPFIAAGAFITIVADAWKVKWLFNISKVLTTLIIIGLCVFSFFPVTVTVRLYNILIMTALILSLGGDIALLFKSNRTFITGLGFFLTAHILFIISFIIISGFSFLDLLPAGMIILLLIIAYRSFSDHLGKMLIPVALYMAVISIMVWRAFSCLFNTSIPVNQSLLIAIGALFFYISDILLGVHRFIFPVDHIILYNLSTYYLALTLITLSCFNA
jgi:alkylglycerol monooxygenase